MDNSYSSLNKLFNNYFDGSINSTSLLQGATTLGFGSHPLIQEIFQREAANRELSSKSPSQKRDLVASKGVEVKDLPREKIELLAESILTQENIVKHMGSQDQLVLSGYEIDLHGLPNLGNTCFANSVLQKIFTSPDIENLLSIEPENTQAQQIQALLVALYSEYKKQDPNKEALINALDELLSHPLFKEKGLRPKEKQEDAHEFYTILAEVLGFDKSEAHSIVMSSLDLSDVPMSIEPMASSIVLGREDGGSISIQEWITRTASSREITTDVFRRTQYVHPHLDEFRSISITLPRFSQNHGKSSQSYTGLSRSITLPIFDESTFQVRTVTLQPKAIICHYGSSISSGHYVTFVDMGTYFEERSDSFTRIVTRDQAEAIFAKSAYLVQYVVDSIEPVGL